MKNKITIAFILVFCAFAISCNNSGQGKAEATDSQEQQAPPEPLPEPEQSTVKPSESNVFASLSYDSVIAYNYDGANGNAIVDSKGKLAKNILKKYEMDRDQMLRLTNIFCDPLTYGGTEKKCFEPHFGVVFYKTDSVIAHVTVCPECNYLRSSIEIIGSGGFSDKGSQRIADFERELKIFF